MSDHGVYVTGYDHYCWYCQTCGEIPFNIWLDRENAEADFQRHSCETAQRPITTYRSATIRSVGGRDTHARDVSIFPSGIEFTTDKGRHWWPMVSVSSIEGTP